MAVPSVAMDEIGIDVRAVEISATLDRAEDGAERLRTGEVGRIEIKSSHGQISYL